MNQLIDLVFGVFNNRDRGEDTAGSWQSTYQDWRPYQEANPSGTLVSGSQPQEM